MPITDLTKFAGFRQDGAGGLELWRGDGGDFATLKAKNLILTALMAESGVIGIVAGTTRTQAGATPLAQSVNRIDTSTPPAAGTSLGDGVVLPPCVGGQPITVINNTNNIIQVYASGSDAINGIAGATGVPIPPGDVALFKSPAAGDWRFEAGVGSVGGFNSELAVDGITAAGTNQATATPLTVDLNRVAAAAAGTGIVLPPAKKGMTPVVMHHGSNIVQCYANGSDTIDDIAGATGVALMLRSTVIFFCFADGAWYTSGLGSGYAPSGLPTVQPQDGVIAAGNSQPTATQLTGEINTVATVPPGTGVNLPASFPGLPVSVINNGANPLLVYPFQGAADTINGIAATLGVILLPNSIGSFECTALGAWTYSATTPVQAGYNTNNATAGFTLPAAAISGSQSFVALNLTGALAGAANVQLPTVAALLAALHGAASNTSFVLRIINSSAGNFAWTVTTNTGWTLGGTMSIAQNTYRDFVVKFAALGAATLQSIGTGTWS